MAQLLQPGPKAHAIADVAYALDVDVGPDPTAFHSLPQGGDDSWYDSTVGVTAPRAVLSSSTLGYGKNDSEVNVILHAAIDKIANAGVEVIEADVFDKKTSSVRGRQPESA